MVLTEHMLTSTFGSGDRVHGSRHRLHMLTREFHCHKPFRPARALWARQVSRYAITDKVGPAQLGNVRSAEGFGEDEDVAPAGARRADWVHLVMRTRLLRTQLACCRLSRQYSHRPLSRTGCEGAPRVEECARVKVT
jgi:hypothetical protein